MRQRHIIKLHNTNKIKNAPFLKLLLKMVLASNDLQATDSLFKLIDEKKKKDGKYKFELGHKQLIIRLQISILKEIIYGEFKRSKYIPGIIETIKEENSLNKILVKCSKRVQERFNNIYRCCKNQPDEHLFKQYIKSLRDKIGFHYDNKIILQAFESVLLRNEFFKIEIANHISKWRFHFGDLITDEIVCSLWDIKYSERRVEEADKVASWIIARTRDYIDFSGNFISTYLSYYAHA